MRVNGEPDEYRNAFSSQLSPGDTTIYEVHTVLTGDVAGETRICH